MLIDPSPIQVSGPLSAFAAGFACLALAEAGLVQASAAAKAKARVGTAVKPRKIWRDMACRYSWPPGAKRGCCFASSICRERGGRKAS